MSIGVKMENKIYNKKAEIDKNKVLIILDEIIYPKSLKEIINEFRFDEKEFEFQMFINDSYVWVITLHDTDKKRLDEVTLFIQNSFWDKVNSIGTVLADGKEFIETLREIKEKLNNKIPEKIFHEWFMTLAIHMSQFKHPINCENKIKKEYLPNSKVISLIFKNNEGEGNLYSNYIFFSSEGKLLSDFYIEELIKRVDKKIKERWKNNSKKNNKRNPIDSRLRHEVFKRDGYKCIECGATNKEKILHADHIIPVSQGGTDELNNLQTMCEDCNLAKSDKAFKGGKEEKNET